MYKMVRIPFDLETAKKIQSGEVEGKIVTRYGDQARIICWNKKTHGFPIVALISEDGEEESCEYYPDNGKWDKYEEHNLDLMLEIPEYITFKDGDVIAFNDCNMVAIIQGECGKSESGEYYCKTYVVTNSKGKAVFLNHPIITNEARKATEEEKQHLIDAIKESTEPKAKECLKRFFGIETKKEEYKFSPFEKVLVRDYDTEIWMANFFSHYCNNETEFNYGCVSKAWCQCIPYKGNESLLGKKDSNR